MERVLSRLLKNLNHMIIYLCCFFFFAVEPKLNRREPPFFADTLVRYFIVLLVNRSIASEEKYLLDYKVSCFFVVLSRQRRFGQKH